jgi:1,4-dihydroxy-2-naphthoate octaprenyltransferase
MINDLWDYRNGVDDAALQQEGLISTNSGFLANNVMSEKQFARLTWGLFGLGLLCGIVLAIFRGPWVIGYGLLGALLAYFYVAPPIRYGYRGKGYSEVSIVISFGVLPVLGSFYVQTLQYDTRALLASLPVGLLTTLILFNHHFLHWQADEASGKRTLVVVWGEQKSLGFSRLLLILSYLSVVVGVIWHALPIYALLSILTIFKPLQVYRRLQAHNPSEAYLPLMGASLSASSQTGLILVICLILHGLFGW